MSQIDPRPSDNTSHPVPAVPGPAVPAAAAPIPPFAAPWESESKQSGFNFIAFLHSFRRRWLLGVGLGVLLATVIAATLWAMVPIRSEAIVQLRVYRDTDDMLTTAWKAQPHPQDFEINKQTQMAMLTSPFVASAALRTPGIGQLPLVRYKPWFGKRENPIAWLEKQLKVQSAEGSELVQVSMKAPYHQRDQLVTLLDAVKDAYKREVVDGDIKEARQKLEKLKDSQRDLGRSVRDQMEQIAELTKTYGSMDSENIKVQLELFYRQLASLERDKAGLDMKWNEVFDAFLLHRTRMQGATTYEPAPWEIEDVMLQGYPEYAALKTQQIELQNAVQMSGGRGGVMGGGAQMQGQLQMLNQQMEQFKYDHQEEAIARLKSMQNRDGRIMQEEYQMLQVQLESLDKRRTATGEQIETLQNRVRAMGEFNGDLEVRKLDLESDRDMLSKIDQEIQTLQLDMSRRPKIQVLQEAMIPDTEGSWLTKYMQVIASWLFTFMGTLLGVALWDMQHQRVNTSQEVIDTGDVRVIGTLPALNSRRIGGLLPASGGQRKKVEMTLMRNIDSIRTALLFARSDRPYEVILVSSALGSEGKTTVASQLAVSFARSGRRTLLIDGDIRNPQQHVVLGMPMEKGLSEVLRSECTLDDVLQPTSAEGLWSLSAGYRDAYTDQVMASAVVSKMFADLRSRFDMIVIDTGPVLTSPDAMLLGQHADATVLSVRRDVSRLPKVNEAVDRLRAVGVHIAGVVLNGAGVDVRENEIKQIGSAPAATAEKAEPVAAAATASVESSATPELDADLATAVEDVADSLHTPEPETTLDSSDIVLPLDEDEHRPEGDA